MEPAAQHLDDDTLAAYIDGRLAAGELGRAEKHIDACGSCRRELSTLASLQSEPRTPHGDAPTGTLGRYEVLRELGRGSMGIVLRAYDPELARPVALKLVRDVDADMRELLRREARALAKLRHAHVVTVYDVLVEGDTLGVAMELVEGATLRGYCRGKSVREILDACVKAGRGLAAAHAAGVVHRDFKPENVLCGDDDAIKVGDFGLARDADESPDGALCGTPAYMAPEVVRREVATVASDQYSYCVTVHEMLTGERPSEAVADSLPTWVARALRRGLAANPTERFPSVQALVDVLASDPPARRRNRLLVAVGALATLGAGAAISQAMSSRDDAAVCAIEETRWNPVQRESVRVTLTPALGLDGAGRVTAALDRYMERTAASRRDACVSHDTRTLACLDRGRHEVSALVSMLTIANEAFASRAFDAIGQLPDPSSCATATALPDDAAGRTQTAHERSVLARANALIYAGELAEADALAAPLTMLRAEALLLRARVATERGDNARAEQLLFDALHAAEAAHDDVLAATIWVEIVQSTGAQQQRFELALSNARAADAALARITPSTELQLRYGYVFGTLLLQHGQLDEARKRLELVVPLGALDPMRQVQLGQVELALCDVLRQQGTLSEARDRCTAGMTRIESVLGSDQLRVAVHLSQIGALAYAEHDLTAASAAFARAIDIFERRGGTGHHGYALALSNLGAMYSERNDIANAKAYATRALAAFDKHHPKHPQRLMPLQNLANLMVREGRSADAIPYYIQVRDARRATFAPEHPSVLAADYNLALAYRSSKQAAKAEQAVAELVANALRPGKEAWMIAGRALDLAGSLASDRRDYDAALAAHEKALAALSKISPSIHRAVVQAHIGESQIARRQYAAAVTPLEEALAYFVAHEADLYDLGTTRVALARALGAGGRSDQRAIALMRQGAADLAKLTSGETLAWYREVAAKWLKANDPQHR